MALTHRQVWPTAAAGTIAAADIRARQLAYMIGELAPGAGQSSAPGVRAWWTDDGDVAGASILASGCPWFDVVTADASDFTAVSQLGRWGPIMDPDDARLAQDLFMWRWLYTSSRWALEIYQTGLSGTAGQYLAQSSRHFLAFSNSAGA